MDVAKITSHVEICVCRNIYIIPAHLIAKTICIYYIGTMEII